MSARKALILAISGTIVVLFGAWYLFMRRSNFAASAREAVIAMKSQDGAALLKYAVPDEVSCSGLNPEKMNQILAYLAKTSYKGLKEGAIKSDGDSLTGDASITYVDDQGRDHPMGVVVNKGADGSPVMPVLTTVVSNLWREDKTQAGTPNGALAYLNGLHRDRAFFESIGIKSIMFNPQRCFSWDELEHFLQHAYDQSMAASKAR